MLKSVLKKSYLWIYNHRNHTSIKSINASVNAAYGPGVLIDKNTIVESDVSIGDYSYVNKNSSVENCEIGKYCSISSGVFICPFEHDLESISTHPLFESRETRPKRRKKVVIGNDVLISLNAIILEGVHIGNGAVIAAGAVVTKDVQPYEIVGGIPAKHIGYRCSEKTIEYLNEYQWWNLGREVIDELRRKNIRLDGFEKQFMQKEDQG